LIATEAPAFVESDVEPSDRAELVIAYASKAELARQRGAVTEQQLPEPVHAEPVIGEKVTSPELAKLASKYVRMSDNEMYELFSGDRSAAPEIKTQQKAYDDVRRLAASVLSQAEGGVK
jgi:glycerol-3-phosphate O-acyltransferase